MEELQILSG